MPDHSHPELATSRDLNGFGARLNDTQVKLGQVEEKTERNEKDIARVFDLVGKAAQTQQEFHVDTATRFGKVETRLVSSVSAIDQKVSNLKWWIIGGIGTGAFIIGVVVKFLP